MEKVKEEVGRVQADGSTSGLDNFKRLSGISFKVIEPESFFGFLLSSA